MSPRRIVLVLQDPPLPFGRAMGRWYYVLLKGLVGRGHRVTALTTCSTAEEAEQARALFPGPEYDLRAYVVEPRAGLAARIDTWRRPYSYLYGPAFRRDLDAALARGFDVLHLEVLWSGWVGLDHRDRAVVSVPYLFEIDMADQPPRSARGWVQRKATYRAERALLRHFRRIVAVSPRLADRIRRVNPSADVRAVPFALDLSLYPYIESPPADRPPTVGMIASFNWTPGFTAGLRILQRLWPAIRSRVPDARLELAGVDARRALADYVDLPGVTIRDRVADVPEFFRGIDLQLYAPNPSSGMKFKVLEAFGFGVPVVTNAAGVEGIPAVDGIHAGLCEDDDGLIERTVGLLADPARRDRQRAAARALLEAHCSPGPVLDRVEALYETVGPAQFQIGDGTT